MVYKTYGAPSEEQTKYSSYPIYQPLRSDRIWHKVNF